MATASHQYEDKLLDFAYGELPAPEASAVESHLKSCRRCSQALAQIRGVRTTMAALSQEPAPIAGLESLLAYAEQAAARNATAPKEGIPWWRRLVAPLAGACALALVAVVAVKTQQDGGLEEFSAEKAALEAKPRRESRQAPVAAAPALPAAEPAPEPKAEGEAAFAQGDNRPTPQKVAEKMKAGKTSGALRRANGWDTAPNDALAKNGNEDGYSQQMGATAGPKDARQQAQRADLGNAVAAAKKSEQEAPVADFGNARGSYVQEKKAKAQANKVQEVLAESADKADRDLDAKTPPMGLSTAPAAKPSAPPPTPKTAPSLGVGLGSAGGSASTGSPYGGGGRGGLGTRSPSTYKQESARAADDEIAERGTSDLADRKRMEKDVQAEAREQDLAARGPLEAARAAGNAGNRQEEVKQALAVLQTNVQGSTRAEALNRLCLALEALDNEAQADKYCSALIREFPNSTAAKTIASRRNEKQRESPKPARKKFDSESASPDSRVEPANQPKPASAQ